MHAPTYERARALWKEYCDTHPWSADDPRAELAAEVANRLEQLDLVLEHLSRSLKAVEPTTPRGELELIASQAERYRAGELSIDEYEAVIRSTLRPTPPGYVKSWTEVRLFTEMFYYVAWRVLEILNASGSRAFDDVGGLDAKGVRNVRNILLEHPEHGRPQANYAQSLAVTDDGPALKTSTVVVRQGRTSADPEGVDRGLFRNAEELRVKFESKVEAALRGGTAHDTQRAKV